jgi:hypothetical protein
METKLIEVRDRMTCIVVLCVRPWPVTLPYDVDRETDKGAKLNKLQRMAWRCGYKEARAVIMTRLAEPGRGAQSDPFEWLDRTMSQAHNYIEQNWEKIPNGGLVDVRVVLGEEKEPAESEFSTDEL